MSSSDFGIISWSNDLAHVGFQTITLMTADLVVVMLQIDSSKTDKQKLENILIQAFIFEICH